MKTFKVKLSDEKLVVQSGIINFLNKVKGLTIQELEALFLHDVQKLYTYFENHTTDQLVEEFCTYMKIRQVEEIAAGNDYEFMHRKCKSKKEPKKEDFTYIYQIKDGFNIFLHPVDVEYMEKAADERGVELSPLLEVN